MKLHSDTITKADVRAAMRAAVLDSKITPDVHFVIFAPEGSRLRRYGYEIQLGTFDKTSGPTSSRRFKNTGYAGAGRVWAATYDEWGWLIAELFKIDPALIFGQWKHGVDRFHSDTANAYRGV